MQIIFKKFKGETIALFYGTGNETSNPDKYIMSYMHMGQHGEAHKTLKHCRNASRQEYQELRKELLSIGYDRKYFNY